MWDDPPPDATHLAKKIHALRRWPIGWLDAQELGILIGQGEGLDVLIPLALSVLGDDLFPEVDCYSPDLLATVLRVLAGCWTEHPDRREDLRKIVEAVVVTEMDELIISGLVAGLGRLIEDFRAVGRA